MSNKKNEDSKDETEPKNEDRIHRSSFFDHRFCFMLRVLILRFFHIRSAVLGILVIGTVLFLLPLPDALLHGTPVQSRRILDRRGTLLYETRPKGMQERVALARIPPFLIDALLATEDRRFHRHRGISIRGLARAMFQNVTAGRVVSGGSTLTQQLVRIRLQNTKRTLLAKIREAFWAVKIEQTLSKDDIVEAYMNEAYFGHQAYGISSAAHLYFGKSLIELSQAEGTFLIGLLQSPSRYDPFRAFDKAKARHRAVLRSLIDERLMDETEAESIAKSPLRLAPDRVPIRAPHFAMWVLGERPEHAERDIRTTLDLSLQTTIERIIETHLHRLKGKNVTSAAVVVLDLHTGDILSMVGSSDYFDDERDGAVNVALSPRQPGSTMKPFAYALAFAQGKTAASTVADVEAHFLTQEGTPYTPRNYDFEEHGLVRYREALANSHNIPAVRVLESIGVDRLLQFLRETGFTSLTQTPDHYGLALTLGDAEVPLLELTAAYGIFAHGGETLRPRFLLTDELQKGTQIVDERIAWLITDILSDNEARTPEFGEGSPLAFPFPVAAKNRNDPQLARQLDDRLCAGPDCRGMGWQCR